MVDHSGHDATVLFSGGPGSTLAALRVGETARHVHLLTFASRGLVGSASVEEHLVRLGRFYGDPHRYSWRTLPIDALCAALMSDRVASLRRHGIEALSPAASFSTAFHARALAYCLDNGIRRVADGSVSGDAGPAGASLRRRLAAVYGAHGIAYSSPIFDEGPRVEDLLHQLRYSRAPSVRGTKLERRVRSDWVVLERLVTFASAGRAGAEEWAEDRLAILEEWAREHARSGVGSRLARLCRGAS